MKIRLPHANGLLQELEGIAGKITVAGPIIGVSSNRIYNTLNYDIYSGKDYLGCLEIGFYSWNSAEKPTYVVFEGDNIPGRGYVRLVANADIEEVSCTSASGKRRLLVRKDRYLDMPFLDSEAVNADVKENFKFTTAREGISSFGGTELEAALA